MENKPVTVLAVDDNLDNLVTIRALVLEKFPTYRVLTASSGIEGIALALGEDPDVILLDILMPDMDGYEVCRKLKASAELRDIPVVFVTALKSDRENRIAALEAGADGFLAKPIDEAELAAQVKAMVKIKAFHAKDRNRRNVLEQLVAERTKVLHRELAEKRKTEAELLFATRRLNAFWDIATLHDADLHTTCDHLLSSIVTMTDSAFGFFGFINDDESVMTIYAWSGEAMKGCSIIDKPSDFLIKDAGIWGEAVRQRQSLIINDYTAAHPAKKGLPGGHVPLKKLLVIPIILHDKIVSVAAVANRAIDYSESDVRQIRAFAENVQMLIARKKAEFALQESEDRYRRITEGLTDYVYSVRVDEGKAVATRHSSACEKVTGYTADEFTADPYLWITMVPEEERGQIILRAEEILKGKQVGPVEHHIRRKDGGVRWISDTAVLNKNARGNLVSYEGVVRDISDRKMLDDAQSFLLQCGQPGSGETFFHALARYLAQNLDMEFVCIDRLDSDGLTAHPVIVFNNGSFDNNVSYALRDTPCGEVVGRQVCCYPDDVCRLFPRDAALCDLRAESYIGTTLWSFNGKPIGLIAVVGQKALKNPLFAENLLKLVAIRAAGEMERMQAEQRFYTIFENAPLGIALIDSLTGKIGEVNPQFAQIAGRTREEMVAIDWMSITHPDDIKEDLDNMALMNDGKIPGFSMQKRYIRPDGSHVWINMTIAPLPIEHGDRLHHLTMIEDITEKRAFEMRLRQSEKMEAIGQLAGGIAHDFNNVLGGIIGYTDMSLDLTEKGSALDKNLRKVLKAADRAKNLVQQILTFSRQGGHKKSVTALRPIVKEVMELLRASIPTTVTIESELQPDVKPVLADPTQIHEMLLNLATNAVHAMDRRGILKVRLSANRLTHDIVGRIGTIAPGEYAVIEVRDDGCGMDTATLDKAFDPFFTTKPVGEGTGMGLSVVLGIVQSHHGDLQVESACGKGTSFRVFLPVTTGNADAQEGSECLLPYGGNERILFVDDEKILVEVAEEQFGSYGYTVTGMTNSQKTLKYLTKHSADIDILITDQTMPGMTGVELAKEALKIRHDLPIILCTGYSSEINEAGAIDMGIRCMLHKPIRSQELAVIIRKIFDGTDTDAAPYRRSCSAAACSAHPIEPQNGE